MRRLVKIPPQYYNDLRKVQERLYREQGERVPLWKCFREVEMEKMRWPDAKKYK